MTQTGPCPAAPRASRIPRETVSASTAITWRRPRINSARAPEFMALGEAGVTVKNPRARGAAARRMPAQSLSAMTPITKVIFCPGKYCRRLSASSAAPFGLWAPSTMTQGSRRSREKRPGQDTPASPRRTACSGMENPLAFSTSTVSSAAAAFLRW